MSEKRERELEQINEENAKIAIRIGSQYSDVGKKLFGDTQKSRFEKKKAEHYRPWNFSPIKKRKLPMLMNNANEGKENVD